MARLRQYFSNRYSSAEATSAEFESLIRYINSAELGNKTLAELMSAIFNDNGVLDLGIEFRFNPATGIEFRIDSTVDEWDLIVAAEDIRGANGANLGTVEAPLFSNRVDVVATGGQTTFSYVQTSGASAVIVWVNGILRAQSGYTYNQGLGQLVFSAGLTALDLVSIASVRSSPAATYRRVDFVATSGQSIFPFAHESFEEIIVFRNGLFQREGGGFDYVKSSVTDTVTMTTPQAGGSNITIMSISNESLREVTGLMMESRYATDGFIRLDRIAIPNNALSQSLVNGLVPALATRPKITVSTSQPALPVAGDLWINTSLTVPTLLFWDGVRWLSASPNGLVPLPLAANALQFLRLNATATALEYAPFDTSALVQQTSIGVANGVASLGAAGRLPATQLPAIANQLPIIGKVAGAITNSTTVVGILANAKHSFDGITAKLDAGSCTLQLQVGGVSIGSTLSVTTTTTRLAIATVIRDAIATPQDVALIVTGATGASGLTFNIGNSIVE